MLGLQNEREWLAFCDRVLDDAAVATDARFASNSLRHEHRDALRALILDVFSTLDGRRDRRCGSTRRRSPTPA